MNGVTTKDDLLDLHIDAVQNGNRRVRTAFFIALLTSTVILLMVFNIRLSWTRGFPPVPQNVSDKWVQEAYKEQIKHFFERTLYSVPGVGVQLSSDDLGFFGPLVCFIAAFYYAACVRVTRLSMSELVRTKGPDPTLHEKAFAILQGEMVLNSVEAIEDTKGLTPFRIYRLLIWLPAIAGLVAVLTDAYSYAEAPWDNPGVALIFTMTWSSRIKAVSFECVGLLLTLLTWIYLRQSYRFVEEIRIGVLQLRPVPPQSVASPAMGAPSVQ